LYVFFSIYFVTEDLCVLVWVLQSHATITLTQMENFFQSLLTNLSQPEYGLVILFGASLLAATLLPLGSEPVLLGLITLNPTLLWPALCVATLGNTLGSVIGWWMGVGADHLMTSRNLSSPHTHHLRALQWLQRLGPVACLGAWLPVVGDALCVVAGYLRLPFWPCVCYMALGKALRYGVLVFGWQWLV
jgi:membrane protein YqaA with SNARE-associated domain